MSPLEGKRVIVGVTGSIAAYKSALLIRALVTEGAEVRVIMTPAACEFITPLTLATLSQNEVVIEMFPENPEKGTWHIHLGMWADCMIIAPASANTIAKLAHGFADNALCSLALALRCPMIVAPVMDMDMLLHVATQDNTAVLRKRGVTIIEPEEGELASGLMGPGRLPDMPVILSVIGDVLAANAGDLHGRRVLISAGPTHERLDDVRYLGNFSSGKMGFALAEAAQKRSAQVTLVTGPVALATPDGVTRIDVESAEQMFEAMKGSYESADIVIMSAAVADFRPEQKKEGKIKKDELSSETLDLTLVRNPDILAWLGENKGKQILVGFALETDKGMEHASKKLLQKKADMIVLNNPSEEGAGFGTDTNIATLLKADGSHEKLALMPKRQLADIILDKATAAS
jgi:phosphopantothenoylcysteine decarboxylase / phosphopantothenate---cysteine ligase